MSTLYKNYPIDIIAVFNPVGQIKPLYLRVENEAHRLITLKVNRILNYKEEQYGGIHRIHYYCDIITHHNQHTTCDVYYYIDTHKWILYHPLISMEA